MSYKIHDILNKNENGCGNGVGKHITTLSNYDDIKEFMKLNNLKQIFLKDNKCDEFMCYYIEDFIEE